MIEKNEFFPISTVNLMKALCSIIIVIHHSSFYLPDSAFATIFRPCGYLPVGIFLFISGYGLMVSLYTKEGYLNSFFKKRIPQIVIPAIVALLFYLLLIDKEITFSAFFEGKLPFSHFWYIIVIFGLYLLFWGVFSLVSDKTIAVKITFGLLNTYIIVSMMLGLGSYWYYTIWAYVGGGIFGHGRL